MVWRETCLHHVFAKQPLNVTSNCLELYLIFEGQNYDLILAAKVIYTIPVLRDTLGREREFMEFMRLPIMISWPLPAISWPSTGDSCHLNMGLNVKAKPYNAKNHPAWHRYRRLGIYENLRGSAEVETSAASTRLADFLPAVTSVPDILMEESSVDF